MGIKENIENLSKDACEYVKRSIDGYKLRLVENLSLMLGDALCGFVVSVLLFLALSLMLAALVIVLEAYTGIVCALLVAAAIVLLLALLLYGLRVRLFVNGVVRHLCRFLFAVGDDGK